MDEMLPKSLIILKNSIIKGRVPTSNDLEVGEIALGLFKGQESIWSKNSSGEVINLRSPRHDLVWGDLFKKYETKIEFEEDLSLGNILDTSLVFIEETRQIWSDNNFYGCELTWDDIESYILSQVIVFPQEVTDLIDNYDPDTTTHEIISSAFKGKINFIRLVRNLNKKPYVTSLKLDGGVVPITTTSKEISNKEYILNLEYYLGGVFIQVTVKLENDIFSITKKSADFINVSNNIEEINGRLDAIEETIGSGVAESILWTEVIDA